MIHPGYKGISNFFQHDIALIRLKGKAKVNGELSIHIKFASKIQMVIFLTRALNVICSSKCYVLDFVKPICLPYEDDTNENYEEFEKEAKGFHKLWVAGWGATTARGIFSIIVDLINIVYIETNKMLCHGMYHI